MWFVLFDSNAFNLALFRTICVQRVCTWKTIGPPAMGRRRRCALPVRGARRRDVLRRCASARARRVTERFERAKLDIAWKTSGPRLETESVIYVSKDGLK